jgi:hypothetical protein
VSPVVGGSPSCIASGADALGNAATAVKSASAPITTYCNAAGAACGDAHIDGALTRFASALGTYIADLGLQLDAASTLAQSGSHDLITAGG